MRNKLLLAIAVEAGDAAACLSKKIFGTQLIRFGQIRIDLGEIWVKSKSCIPQNIRSPTDIVMRKQRCRLYFVQILTRFGIVHFQF